MNRAGSPSPVTAPAQAAPWVLIGAAHVVDLTAPLRATLAGRPLDGIAIELDQERAASMLAPPARWRRGPAGPSSPSSGRSSNGGWALRLAAGSPVRR